MRGEPDAGDAKRDGREDTVIPALGDTSGKALRARMSRPETLGLPP